MTRLDEIKKRVEAATHYRASGRKANMLIAVEGVLAREDVPWLLGEVERLDSELNVVRKGYADAAGALASERDALLKRLRKADAVINEARRVAKGYGEIGGVSLSQFNRALEKYDSEES